MKEMTRNKTQLVLLLFFLICSSISRCCFCSLQTDFSILSQDSEESTLEERVVELFQRWREKHGKAYRDVEEMDMRLENFRKNFKYVIGRIRDSNSLTTGKHEVGLNEFADLSNEEFREVYSSKIGRPIKHQKITDLRRTEGRMESCEAPSSLDWRKKGIVTGVKNQKQCGSCWAFSSTGAIEGINALATGNLISLSEQELVDCDSTCDGCGGGNMDSAFEWVINNGGMDTESGYPYKAYDGTCNITKEETKVVTIDGYEDVAQEEAAILCAVAKQPVSVGIDGSKLDFQLYTGGIYDGECSSNPNDIDHAVLIVGYGSDNYQDYWIVKNSWGTNWGMGGYIYIKRNTELPYGVCAINAMASYPTKSSESPSPFPPPVIPPPPPPPPSQPPPSPYPCPTQCGETTYCPCGSTCCCMFEFFGVCLLHGCCEYENAVCCADSIFCCPHDYPICDIDDGLCLQSYGDIIGLAAKKRKTAKHKLPWTKLDNTENTSQHLQWKRRQFAASS